MPDTIIEIEDTWKLPFADLFRPLTADEEKRLRESVRTHGVKHHVLTYDSPTWGADCVIDGANRLRIGQEEGKEVPVTKIPGLTDEAARELAVTLNADRRHLTIEEQMAARAARVERVAEARKEGESLRAIAEKEGVSKSQVERDLEETDSGVPGGTPDAEPEPETDSGTNPLTPEPAKVKGRDGKTYSATRPPKQPPAGNPPSAPPASTPIDLPKPEDSPRDVLGRVIPKYLVDVFAKRADVKAVSSAIGKAAGGLKALDADAELGGFARKRPHLRLDLAAVSDWARTRLAPFCVCPCCDGDGDSGRCPSCGGRGWLTKAGLKLCSPEAQAKAASFKPGDAWEGDDPVPLGCECDGAAEPERRFAAPGVDARETPIPKHLRDLFEPDFLLDAIHDLKRLESVLQDAKSWLHWLKPESLAAVAQLIRYLSDAIPSEVCVSCGGSGKDCGSCLTSGYHPRWSCEAGQNRPPEPATLAPEKAKPAAAPKKTTPEKKSGKLGKRGAA